MNMWMDGYSQTWLQLKLAFIPLQQYEQVQVAAFIVPCRNSLKTDKISKHELFTISKVKPYKTNQTWYDVLTKSIRYSCVKHYAFCLQIDADSSGDEITWTVTHFNHGENDNTYLVCRIGSGNTTIDRDSLVVSIVHSRDTHVRTVTVYITLTKQYCKINVQTNDMLTF